MSDKVVITEHGRMMIQEEYDSRYKYLFEGIDEDTGERVVGYYAMVSTGGHGIKPAIITGYERGCFLPKFVRFESVNPLFGIRTMQEEIHQNAKDHGWWDEERSFGELIALCHCELSEALEEYRDGHAPNEIYFNGEEKPEGIPIELADVVIRIMDMCGRYGINLHGAIVNKHAYNKTRPYKHGGKVI